MSSSPSSMRVLATAALVAGCEGRRAVEWPLGNDFAAIFVLEIALSEVTRIQGPFRLVGDEIVEGGAVAKLDSGDETSVTLVGIDDLAVAELARRNFAFERLLRSSMGLTLRIPVCDAAPDRAPLPPSTKFFGLEGDRLLETTTPPPIDVELVLAKPISQCHEYDDHLVSFDAETLLLPSGTEIGGVPRVRSFDSGSSYLHLDKVLRVDDDLVFARSDQGGFLFRRGRPYRDEEGHRHVFPRGTQFQGNAAWFGDRIVVMKRESVAGLIKGAAMLEFEIVDDLLHLVRTTTVPGQNAEDFAISRSGTILITIDGGSAALAGSLETGEFEPVDLPAGASIGLVHLLDPSEETFVLSDRGAKALVGPATGPFQSFDLRAAGSTLVQIADVALGKDRELWLVGQAADSITDQPDLVRIDREGRISKRSLEIPTPCGSPDSCGATRAPYGRFVDFRDRQTRDELILAYAECRAIFVLQPIEGCQSSFIPETATELKGAERNRGWLTVVGKEGAVLELRLPE
ncbi:MAG: hypothetical protein HY791_06755 [Deltaproteobacteria bacterium]|nr:hypothetical protein [Deltaproteobacteria bacterium]